MYQLILKILPKFDWWLTGICLSRAFGGLIAMTYAAPLPVLQKEWGMSAAAGGSVSSAYHIGYAVSLVVLSSCLWPCP
jgi:hypothetical protein